jgi:NADH-quinone oxidoreductase subunit L
MAIELIYLTVALPLAGFLVNGLLGSRIKNEKAIGAIGSGVVGLSFVVVVWAFFETLGKPVGDRTAVVELYSWLAAGDIGVSVAYQVDQLSLVMAMVVTGVGFLIHVYSIGYMHGDKAFWRFFAYLNLFIFAMMNLILADNFVLMFLGWEGVGLCSYLLIGFWYDKKFEKSTTSEAAKKAFVVNRIGDFGFLLGMFLILTTFGSLNFGEVFAGVAAAENVPPLTFELIAIFLFIGATGKSAQIPLYVWLPDAMAGPTPVSALIHAATMVTAGVYMVARTSIIYVNAPTALMVVAVVGLATAFFAATIGLVQNDIKKVLAYSTVSQLGYMFLALGSGAFVAGVFHVMTHAFFKALLFMGAGSVIHGMHEEQDIQKFGGLKKYMPRTYLTFLIASLAISGIPPLAGFFSKDEILWYSFMNRGEIFWIVGAVTALLTAFYMFRLLSLTFYGKPRFDEARTKPHESPSVMTVPLMILAVLSIVGGWIGIPEIFSGEHGNLFHTWLAPVFAESNLAHGAHPSHTTEILLMAISVAGAAGAAYLGYWMYSSSKRQPGELKGAAGAFHKLLFNKYYVDELYDATAVKPTVWTSRYFLWKFIDVGIIDGFINFLGSLVERLSGVLRKMQTGVAQFYAAIMTLGVAITILWIILSL